MIGISSNDAGGAELLSEYVVNNKNEYFLVSESCIFDYSQNEIIYSGLPLGS